MIYFIRTSCFSFNRIDYKEIVSGFIEINVLISIIPGFTLDQLFFLALLLFSELHSNHNVFSKKR